MNEKHSIFFPVDITTTLTNVDNKKLHDLLFNWLIKNEYNIIINNIHHIQAHYTYSRWFQRDIIINLEEKNEKLDLNIKIGLINQNYAIYMKKMDYWKTLIEIMQYIYYNVEGAKENFSITDFLTDDYLDYLNTIKKSMTMFSLIIILIFIFLMMALKMPIYIIVASIIIMLLLIYYSMNKYISIK